MDSATKQAMKDIKIEYPAFYPDKFSYDQFTVTISHLFTKENKQLNKQILKTENHEKN
jgi:hypothetical protein